MFNIFQISHSLKDDYMWPHLESFQENNKFLSLDDEKSVERINLCKLMDLGAVGYKFTLRAP